MLRDSRKSNSALTEEYIDRYKETAELLSKPEWMDIIRKGKEEVVAGVKGKMLDELES